MMTTLFIKDGRCADVDDILPNGYKLKKGDSVYYLAYAMGRNHDIWGQDAEDFRPERWLVDGTFKPESPFKFISFHVWKVLYLIYAHTHANEINPLI